MYSQNNEERFIRKHFGERTGTFLDVGAYDGKTFSNTYALVEKGWGGLEVEASPVNFTGLMKNVRKDNIKLLCAAVCTEPGSITLYDSQGDAITTTDTKHRDKWTSKTGGVDWQPIEILTITPTELLAAYGNEWDMIDIDVEGYSYELFLSFDWEALKNCTLVVIEHDNRVSAIEKRLYKLDYRTTFSGSENIILTRRLR